jgi:hypothetical protein
MAVLWFIHADAMYGFPRLTNSLFPISFANWEARLISSFFAAWIRPPSVPENITAIT